MNSEDRDALEREFDLVMVRAGVSVPPERKAGVIACYADFKRMTAGPSPFTNSLSRKPEERCVPAPSRRLR